MTKQLKNWVKKVQKKADQHAANEIVSFYYREIYAYVYKQTMNKELSLDLTQEIFINMLTSIPHYDEKKASFRTWLYKIATYRIVDYYRSKSYRNDKITELVEEDLRDETEFTISIENKLEAERINEFVNQLDTSRQQIFRLKMYGEYSFAEIGKILKIPESSVKTKYYSLLKLIRKQFGKGGSLK